uniref:Mitochondrial ribosomal protein S28 n=1 Tax=Panagrolaimus sp. PS1159 TaxID=55785 RepID=A0AC35EWU8_9BILA
MLARRLLLSKAFRPSFFHRLQSSSTPPSTESAAAAESKPEEIDFSNFDEFIEDVTSKTQDDNISFAKLLRQSKFVQLGDFNGRVVVGNIVHRVGDDVYIDFGMKFNAVCKAPTTDGHKYTIGSKVLIRLFNPELSERFLGSKHDLTLLEADASLIKLIGVPGQKRRREVEKNENQK